MKKSTKKIIMAGMIALQSFNALAAPQAAEFEQPVAEYTQEQTQTQESPSLAAKEEGGGIF